MTAILGSPTYGPVEPTWRKSLIMGIMHSANNGLVWLGDASTDKVSFSGARNEVCQTLMELNGDADGIVWVDSDIIMPVNAITRLLHTAREHGFHILSGVYHQKVKPHKPVIYHYKKDIDKFHQITEYETNQIITPGGCGFGFVWTSYECIKEISALKDFEPLRGGWFPDTRHLIDGKGEDLAFCSLAMKAGFDVHVDTGIQLGHASGYYTFGRQHFLEHQKEASETPVPRRFGYVDND